MNIGGVNDMDILTARSKIIIILILFLRNDIEINSVYVPG